MADDNGGVERLPDPPDPGPRGPKIGTRQRQERTASDLAAELNVDREGVGTVDRLEGLDVFLRSEGTEQFGQNVASEFATEADFVQANDIDPNVDAQAITAAPVVAPNRRDDVAARARSAAASDDQFAKPGDFRAEVTDRGVAELGFTDTGKRQRASRALTAQTPLSEVDPTADLTPTDDGGFTLDDAAARRSAARGFEDDFEGVGQGTLDPASDVRETEGGFGLAKGAARQAAAARLDSQYPDINITPGDISLSLGDDGAYNASFEREGQR